MCRLKQVVALVGPLGAGKDTVAKHLVEHYDFRRFAFADEIKRNYYAFSGYSEEQFKTARGMSLEKEIRAGLWQYSDRIKREKGSLYFINIVIDAMCDCQQPTVVTDIRTYEELKAMREIGAAVVLVLKIGKDTDFSVVRCHQTIPGSRLLYSDVEKSDDKLFFNYDCDDLEFTGRTIEMFCRHTGILKGEANLK